MRVFRRYRAKTYDARGLKSVSKYGKTLSFRTLSVFLILILLVNAAGTGLFISISSYIERQHRTPHALNSQQNLPFDLASDASSHGDKREQMPQSVLNQLQAQKYRQEHGEQQDRRHVKLLDDQRDEFKKTYLNADGSRTQEVSFQATSYKDKNGKWQDVDMTLVKDSSGKWHSKANSWQVVFGASGEGIQIEKNGHTFTMIPEGGDSNVQPQVTGSAPEQIVTYKNVWSGADLQYKVSGSQVKENIILHSANAPDNYGFALSGANLSPQNGVSGTFALDGDFAGFHIASPSISTKDGHIVNSPSPVSQQVIGDTLQVSLDQEWLKSLANNSFPLVIDPTVFVGSSFQDIDSNNNGCSGCGNLIGHDAIGNVDWHFAYQVTIPGGGTNQVIASAVLHLEMASPPNGITGSEQVTANRVNCSGSFSFGCYDQSYGVATGTATTSGDIELSGLYRAAVMNNDSSPWIMVRGEDGGTIDKFKEFDSSKTKITFTYETLPNQSFINTSDSTITVPLDGGVTVTTQPTLASTAPSPPDPDGPGPMRYRYIIGTGKSTLASNPLNMLQSVTGVVRDSDALDSPQWVVPDGVLQDGNTYYWQAAVWDGYTTTPIPWVYSPVYSFKVDLRNGKDELKHMTHWAPLA